MSEAPRHPSIVRVGAVTRTAAGGWTITGWGLAVCLTGCGCHRDPVTRQMTTTTDGINGTLGLTKHRACTCCVPWTVRELAAFTADLAALDAMDADGVEPDRNRKPDPMEG